MAHGKPPALTPCTIYVNDDLIRWLDACVTKLRCQGNQRMDRSRLASCLIYIGSAGQCYKDGARELGDELVARADALAHGCPLPGA